MSLALIVYLISLLTPLHIFLTVITVGLLLAFVIYMIDSIDRSKPIGKYGWWSIIGAIVITFINIIVPRENTVWKMTGAYAVQKIAEDPKTAQISGKVITIIEQKLDSIIAEEAKKQHK